MEHKLYLNELWGGYYTGINPGQFWAWRFAQREAAWDAADPHRCTSCEFLHYGCPFDGRPNMKDPISKRLCY
jgi:hypothetical protein